MYGYAYNDSFLSAFIYRNDREQNVTGKKENMERKKILMVEKCP